MRTITIAAIALAATVGVAAGQTQRSERPTQERQELRSRIADMEARYEQLMQRLADREPDRRTEAELRDMERALERLRAELPALESALAQDPVESRRLQEQFEVMRQRTRNFEEQYAAEREQMVTAEREQVERMQSAAREMQERAAVAERERAERTQSAARELRERAAVTEREQFERVRELQEQAAIVQREQAGRVQSAARQLQERAALAERERSATRLQWERAAADQRERADRAVAEMEEARQRSGEERERVIQRALERMDRAAADRAELFESFDVSAELDRLYGDGPRASWAQQDPADSVWRAARDRLNRRQYEEAAELFNRIHTAPRYRQSTYRADALYWHAFALNRIGTDESVRQSMEVLQQLIREYPANRRPADTNSLLATVQVRLAEMGSSSARRQLREVAIADQRALRQALEVQAVQEVNLADQVAAVSARNAATAADVQRALIAQGVSIDANPELAAMVTWGLPANRISSLSAQCARDESEIRLIALNSLVRMDTAAAMPVLTEVMARRDPCSAPLRQSAMMIVTRIQTAEAQRILTEAARSDPDPDVRRSALMYLSTRDEPQAVAIAEQVLQSAQSDEDRLWVIQALARMRNERAWTVLRNYAGRTDVSTDIRRTAIAALSGSDNEANAQFLRQMYNREGADREIKEAILMSSAMRRGGDPEWLLAIAQNEGEDARLREFAVTALSRSEEVGTPRFIVLYDRMSDKRIKLALVRVLSDRARTDSEAVAKLIAIARDETDTDLRKSAVLGLPPNDPRARELLLEILRGR